VRVISLSILRRTSILGLALLDFSVVNVDFLFFGFLVHGRNVIIL
jgi:hypothetical protein